MMKESTIQARDEAMAAVEQTAGGRFHEAALNFVVTYLRAAKEASGETITDACKAAGIVPHDDRAFGPVYMKLARAGIIQKNGSLHREKGHGTSGANIWRLHEAR